MPALISFRPKRAESRIQQAQIVAVVALERARNIADRQIDRLKEEIIRALMCNAPTEPGMYVVELQESIEGGQRIQQLIIR